MLYLPTIIGFILKYGSYISTAETVLKQVGPLAQDVATALVPVVEKNFGDLKAETPADIVSGVKTILAGIGHPPLDAESESALTDVFTRPDFPGA
jgi:hypothetical protein